MTPANLTPEAMDDILALLGRKTPEQIEEDKAYWASPQGCAHNLSRTLEHLEQDFHNGDLESFLETMRAVWIDMEALLAALGMRSKPDQIVQATQVQEYGEMTMSATITPEQIEWVSEGSPGELTSDPSEIARILADLQADPTTTKYDGSFLSMIKDDSCGTQLVAKIRSSS